MDKSKLTNAKKDFFADYIDKLALFLTRHHSWLVLLHGKTSKKKRPRSSPPELVMEGDITRGHLPEAATTQEVSIQVSPRSLSHPSSFKKKRKKAKGGKTGDSQNRKVQPKGDSKAESPPRSRSHTHRRRRKRKSNAKGGTTGEVLNAQEAPKKIVTKATSPRSLSRSNTTSSKSKGKSGKTGGSSQRSDLPSADASGSKAKKTKKPPQKGKRKGQRH